MKAVGQVLLDGELTKLCMTDGSFFPMFVCSSMNIRESRFLGLWRLGLDSKLIYD